MGVVLGPCHPRAGTGSSPLPSPPPPHGRSGAGTRIQVSVSWSALASADTRTSVALRPLLADGFLLWGLQTFSEPSQVRARHACPSSTCLLRDLRPRETRCVLERNGAAAFGSSTSEQSRCRPHTGHLSAWLWEAASSRWPVPQTAGSIRLWQVPWRICDPSSQQRGSQVRGGPPTPSSSGTFLVEIL